MNYHRGLLFWGLAMIAGGAVALAVQQGYLDAKLLAGAWRLWPLILVAIGLSILLSRTRAAILGTIVAAIVVGTAGGALIAVGPGAFSCGGSDPTSLTTRQGTLGKSADVQLDFNCGTLSLGMSEGDQWSVATGRSSGSEPGISADSNHLGVRSPSDSWFNSGRQLWNVTLPTATSYQLQIMPNAADTAVILGGGHFTSVSVHPNAGSLFLDLTDAQVPELGMSLNAGSASIVISSPMDMSASLSVNAGSIELCVTGDVALRISSEANLTFSTNLEKTSLVRNGNTWSTAGYDRHFKQVHIQLSGNASSFTLNPEGGCS